MDNRLKLPTMQEKREGRYLIEDGDGFLMSVPESRLNSGDSGRRLPDSLRERAVADLTRMLRKR